MRVKFIHSSSLLVSRVLKKERVILNAVEEAKLPGQCLEALLLSVPFHLYKEDNSCVGTFVD